MRLLPFLLVVFASLILSSCVLSQGNSTMGADNLDSAEEFEVPDFQKIESDVETDSIQSSGPTIPQLSFEATSAATLLTVIEQDSEIITQTDQDGTYVSTITNIEIPQGISGIWQVELNNSVVTTSLDQVFVNAGDQILLTFIPVSPATVLGTTTTLTSRTCSFRGSSLSEGESIKIDACNNCTCENGELLCSALNCSEI